MGGIAVEVFQYLRMSIENVLGGIDFALDRQDQHHLWVRSSSIHMLFLITGFQLPPPHLLRDPFPVDVDCADNVPRGHDQDESGGDGAEGDRRGRNALPKDR